MHYNHRFVNADCAMADNKDNLKDFEKALQQLEKIVSRMESGELGLEDSLEQFEQGVKLAKSCQDRLASAQGSVASNLVEVYRALGGGWELRPSADPVELLPDATREEMQDRTKYWDRQFDER